LIRVGRVLSKRLDRLDDAMQVEIDAGHYAAIT